MNEEDPLFLIYEDPDNVVGDCGDYSPSDGVALNESAIITENRDDPVQYLNDESESSEDDPLADWE